VSATAVLRLRGLSKAYGALAAVDEVTLDVHEGERHAVIGPNGAGKTTLLNLVSGRVRATAGTIVLRGRDVTRHAEHRRARLGIAKTFQRSSLLDGLTVRDNLAVAVQRHAGVARRCVRPRRRDGAVGQRVGELLEQTGLAGRGDHAAGELSHGERRQLEIALALAGEPHLLLLDEPAAGMSVAERQAFQATVRALPPTVTVMLIEHDIDLVFALADVVSVMQAGRLLVSGDPEAVRGSPQVRESYLGSADTGDVFVA
jgi:branched-chain amino acid transport system ATP-binding protein